MTQIPTPHPAYLMGTNINHEILLLLIIGLYKTITILKKHLYISCTGDNKLM